MTEENAFKSLEDLEIQMKNNTKFALNTQNVIEISDDTDIEEESTEKNEIPVEDNKDIVETADITDLTNKTVEQNTEEFSEDVEESENVSFEYPDEAQQTADKNQELLEVQQKEIEKPCTEEDKKHALDIVQKLLQQNNINLKSLMEPGDIQGIFANLSTKLTEKKQQTQARFQKEKHSMLLRREKYTTKVNFTRRAKFKAKLVKHHKNFKAFREKLITKFKKIRTIYQDNKQKMLKRREKYIVDAFSEEKMNVFRKKYGCRDQPKKTASKRTEVMNREFEQCMNDAQFKYNSTTREKKVIEELTNVRRLLEKTATELEKTRAELTHEKKEHFLAKKLLASYQTTADKKKLKKSKIKAVKPSKKPKDTKKRKASKSKKNDKKAKKRKYKK